MKKIFTISNIIIIGILLSFFVVQFFDSQDHRSNSSSESEQFNNIPNTPKILAPDTDNLRKTIEKEPYPSEKNITIPFTPQAPHAIWDETHEEACEEASILIAALPFTEKKFTTPKEYDNEILRMIDFEEKELGLGVDINLEQTKTVLQKFYNIQSEVLYEYTKEIIVKKINDGRPIIIPLAGREIGNPYYKQPGPIYHMMVIKGYKDNGNIVITNDPGTKRGADYKYEFEVLYNANHEWDGKGDVKDGRRGIVVVGG